MTAALFSRIARLRAGRMGRVRPAPLDAPTEVAPLPAWESVEGMAALREATAEHAALAPRHRSTGYASTPLDYAPRHAGE